MVVAALPVTVVAVATVVEDATRSIEDGVI